MSAFRDFEQANERLDAAKRAVVRATQTTEHLDAGRSFDAAEKAYKSANAPIESFRKESALELSFALRQFYHQFLMSGIDTGCHSAEYLTAANDRIAPDVIVMHYKSGIRPDPNYPPYDPTSIAKAIVKAAHAQKIPVVQDHEFIKVSEHVKEPEKRPEIFLRALAAYAESIDKPDLAKNIRDAADRMKALVASYQELE